MEYALLVALMAVMLIPAVDFMTDQLAAQYIKVCRSMLYENPGQCQNTHP